MGGFLCVVYYIVWNESNNPDKGDDDDDKDDKDKKNKKQNKNGYFLLNNNDDLDI